MKIVQGDGSTRPYSTAQAEFLRDVAALFQRHGIDARLSQRDQFARAVWDMLCDSTWPHVLMSANGIGDWRDFARTVCEPLITLDAEDSDRERELMELFRQASPAYIAAALAIADHSLAVSEAQLAAAARALIDQETT